MDIARSKPSSPSPNSAASPALPGGCIVHSRRSAVASASSSTSSARPCSSALRGHARLTEAGRAFLPHAEAALAVAQGWARGGARICRPALRARSRSRSSARSPTRISSTHCVGSARNQRRSARAAYGFEQRGERPGAARRCDAGSALFRQRSAGACLLGCRERSHAGGRGTGTSSCRPPCPRGAAARRRAMGWLSAAARRARLGSDPGAPIGPRRARRRRRHLDRQPHRAKAPGPGRLRLRFGAREQRTRRAASGRVGRARYSAMRTAIPIVALHRRNGYLSPAAKALLALLTAGSRSPKARH